MAKKVDKLIWLMWKDEQGQAFKVGELSKGSEKYYFKYDVEGVKRAKEYGFSSLPYFPIVDAKYFREELFNSFSNNLPGYGKKDITSVLKKYDITVYDDFEILKKCGGQTSEGRFEFISPYKEGEEEVKEKEIDEDKIDEDKIGDDKINLEEK